MTRRKRRLLFFIYVAASARAFSLRADAAKISARGAARAGTAGREDARAERPGDGRARRGESGARSGRGAGEEAGEDGMDVSCDET